MVYRLGTCPSRPLGHRCRQTDTGAIPWDSAMLTRQQGHLIGIERRRPPGRGDEHHQFGLIAPDIEWSGTGPRGPGRAQQGDFVDGCRQIVLEQSGQGKALTVVEFDGGIEFAVVKTGNNVTVDSGSQGGVHLADFRAQWRRMRPFPNTLGVKFSCTPNCWYWMVMVVPPLPGWGTGIATSPPARKLAVCPLIASRLGSARSRRRLLVRKAVMK